MRIDKSAMLTALGLESGSLILRTSSTNATNLFDLSANVKDNTISTDVDGTLSVVADTSSSIYVQFKLTSGSDSWLSAVYFVDRFNPAAYLDLSRAYMALNEGEPDNYYYYLAGAVLDYTGLVARHNAVNGVQPNGPVKICCSRTEGGSIYWSASISKDVSASDIGVNGTLFWSHNLLDGSDSVDPWYVWIEYYGDQTAYVSERFAVKNIGIETTPGENLGGGARSSL